MGNCILNFALRGQFLGGHDFWKWFKNYFGSIFANKINNFVRIQLFVIQKRNCFNF